MTATDTIAGLQRQQAALFAEEQQRLAAVEVEARQKWPDAAWAGPPLRMPLAEFDPTPPEQQAWADLYRAAHADADNLQRRHPMDEHPSTPLAAALLEWRTAEASRRHSQMLHHAGDCPGCEVCGADAGRTPMLIAGATTFVCTRCRPSVSAALAAAVAKEPIADGRTRSKAAADFVAGLLEAESELT